MVTHCSGSGNCFPRHVALLGYPLVPCDAPHALVFDHVALAPDECGFDRGAAQIAQILVSCDAWHRMSGIQRSPVAYNLQHLREYNSCQIWASQSRRPPYVADVEGRTRIEGVVALIHEIYLDAHCNKVAEDAVFKTPCVVIIFDDPPIPGIPIEAREQSSDNESI